MGQTNSKRTRIFRLRSKESPDRLFKQSKSAPKVLDQALEDIPLTPEQLPEALPEPETIFEPLEILNCPGPSPKPTVDSGYVSDDRYRDHLISQYHDHNDPQMLVTGAPYVEHVPVSKSDRNGPPNIAGKTPELLPEWDPLIGFVDSTSTSSRVNNFLQLYNYVHTLNPLKTAVIGTKIWDREQKVLGDKDRHIRGQFVTQLLEDGHSQASSAGCSSPTKDHSIITDSDLLSISDTTDPGMCIEIGPLSPLQQYMLDFILRDYQETTRSHNGGNGYSTPPASASSISTSGTSQTSSNRTMASQRDTSGGSNGGALSKIAKQARQDGDRSAVLACPFWKQDRESHRLCCKLTLRRIRDVKQHLHRRHTPDLYCDRCLEIFEDTDRYDVHVQSTVACFRIPESRLRGITRMQSRAISKKSDRNLGEEEQWFAIWDILFPGTTRPASAYVDSDLSEDLNSFQEYWTNRGHDVLMNELNNNNVWSLSPDERETQARQILARGLNSIYEQWVGRRGSTSHTTSYLGTAMSPPLTSASTSGESSIAASSRSSMPNANHVAHPFITLSDLVVADNAAMVASSVEQEDPRRSDPQPVLETLTAAAAGTWPLPLGEDLESYLALAGERTDLNDTASLEILASDTTMEMDFEF